MWLEGPLVEAVAVVVAVVAECSALARALLGAEPRPPEGEARPGGPMPLLASVPPLLQLEVGSSCMGPPGRWMRGEVAMRPGHNV